MRSTSTTTLIEPSRPAMVNRRQPVRETRTNASRSARSAAQTADAKPKAPPGFFPGISHFTDSITALPKEMIRHCTMLKEVDAKVYALEDNLKNLLPYLNASAQGKDDMTRRQGFYHARLVMQELLGPLDEKIHVMSTANDALDKQLARCESAWPQIEQEISEEARWGNPNHWAYTDKSIEKKGATTGERPRREHAVASAHVTAAVSTGDGDAPTTRADAKVKVTRKTQAAAVNDSDFDDRTTKQKAVSNKRSKPADLSAAALSSGIGAATGAASSGKRRKIERTPLSTVAGHALEKSMSSVFGPAARPAASSPQEAPAAEPARKRGRGGTLTAGVTGRRRAGTVNSASNSPQIASSPVLGALTAPARGTNSPALGAAMQRTSSARGRQNSTQSLPKVDQTSVPPEPSQPSALAQLTSIDAETPAVSKTNGDQKVAKTEDQGKPEGDGPTPRPSNKATERAVKREDSTATKPRPPSISTATRNGGKASKAGTPVTASFPSDISIARPRSGRGAAAPLSSSLEPPAKRSHKKGAGMQAQLAAQAAAAKTGKGSDTPTTAAVAAAATTTASTTTSVTTPAPSNHNSTSSIPIHNNGSISNNGNTHVNNKSSNIPSNDDDESAQAEEDEDPEHELKYCYCNSVSYGEMVACDMEGCKGEWFHLACAGLTRAPNPKTKWYCDDCKKKLK